ncbi:MAG: signal peptidase I [Lachnospiraceae bacterium]|nr:signal peptidase I [Lachnospiraceae bacterium]
MSLTDKFDSERPDSEEINTGDAVVSETDADQDEASKDGDEQIVGKTILSEVLSWVLTIAFAFGIALFLNHFIIVNANVPTGSMENTILPGDRLIGNRLAYLKDGPERGDIVMFRYPVDESDIYIKRVIGLPGETIEIREAKIYINGNPEPLYEPYLKEEWVVASDGLSLNIPEGCYFCMGDNRNNSADSRYWAGEAVQAGLAKDYKDAIEKGYCFVKREKILGKAAFEYFPKPKTFAKVEY